MGDSSDEDKFEDAHDVEVQEAAEPKERVPVNVLPAAGDAKSSAGGAASATPAALVNGVVGGGPAHVSVASAADCFIEDTFSESRPPLRDSLPIARPKGYSGLWSAMKNAVGKELSKIAMPVQFNEPISFLQRLAEDLEYSSILDEAAACDDSLVRVALVAALSCTCYASSAEGHRIYKAFNPLLGETFELVRPEAGFRAIGEQVSHHPPITTLHAESIKGWVLSEEYHCDTKFSIRGTLKVIPTGLCRVEIPKYGDRYTYIKPPTTVHNLVFGKVWVEQDGDVEVRNHATGERCVISWQTHSAAKDGYKDLTGKVYDRSNAVRYTLRGGWDKGLALLPGDIPRDRLPKADAVMADPSVRILWRALPTLPHAPVMYGLTKFAMSLNQMEPNICPTDSRLRPDQRMLEDARMDDATAEKRRLEEKQRKTRKEREAAHIEHKPRWFEAVTDKDTARPFHRYLGGYWRAKHSGVFADKKQWADIF